MHVLHFLVSMDTDDVNTRECVHVLLHSLHRAVYTSTHAVRCHHLRRDSIARDFHTHRLYGFKVRYECSWRLDLEPSLEMFIQNSWKTGVQEIKVKVKAC